MTRSTSSSRVPGTTLLRIARLLFEEDVRVETSTGAFRAVGRCPKPVLAAVNGPALAGGFALALLCDVRIASDTATTHATLSPP